LAATDWKVLTDDKKEGLVISLRTSVNGISTVMSTGIIEFPALDIFRTISDPLVRKDYDGVFDSSHVVQVVGP
jgi:hypothetical protein